VAHVVLLSQVKEEEEEEEEEEDSDQSDWVRRPGNR
jgi:hypothetical protein